MKVQTATYINPAPPVMRIDLTVGKGGKDIWPLSKGAVFQSPLSLKNRESRLDGATTELSFPDQINGQLQTYSEGLSQGSRSWCLVLCQSRGIDSIYQERPRNERTQPLLMQYAYQSHACNKRKGFPLSDCKTSKSEIATRCLSQAHTLADLQIQKS